MSRPGGNTTLKQRRRPNAASLPVRQSERKKATKQAYAICADLGQTQGSDGGLHVSHIKKCISNSRNIIVRRSCSIRVHTVHHSVFHFWLTIPATPRGASKFNDTHHWSIALNSTRALVHFQPRMLLYDTSVPRYIMFYSSHFLGFLKVRSVQCLS